MLEALTKFRRRPRKRRSGATIKAISENGQPTYEIADLQVDVGQRQVSRKGRNIELPKLSFDLLLALIEAAPNALSTDELIDRVWAGAVVSSATVAKRVELLRQALGDDSQNPRYIALVRGHGYRLISPERQPAIAMLATGRRRAGIALAAISVVAATIWIWMSASNTTSANSLVVLPFVSMTTDPEDEVFADGLTEELSHALAGVPDLKVTGRTSSFYYKGKAEDLRAIGEALGVEHLLEGSVRRSEDKLRVTAQLIRADNGFHVWSQTYDRGMADIISIQEDIAQNVSNALQQTILGSSTPAPNVADKDVDPKAYALYLRSLGQLRKTSTIGAAEGQRLLEEAVEIDASFAMAWARLALVHGQRITGMDESYPHTPQEGWRRVIAANERALAIDPDNAWAVANHAALTWLLENDIKRAALLFERAVELSNGELEIVAYAASFAKHVGLIDQALEMEEYLISRDPHCAGCRFGLGKSQMFAGRFAEAERTFETLRLMIGGGSERNLGLIWLLQGEPRRALQSFELLDHHLYLRQQGQVMAYYDLGLEADYDAALAELIDRWGDEQPFTVGEAFAYTNQRDEAIRWLERSIAKNRMDLQTDFLEPTFNRIRGDVRWQELLKSIGRAPDQLAEIDFRVSLPR